MPDVYKTRRASATADRSHRLRSRSTIHVVSAELALKPLRKLC
jgi:hypothetical protein